MAWTAPRDWTAISGGIVTAASLNTDLRDNLGVLSTHTHTGAAGFGAASMSGVTLAALVTLTFANQSANPDAAGELQRNGNDLLFYGSSAVNLTAADASAGTASLRTLGTTSIKAAAGNHTHTVNFAEVQTVTAIGASGYWTTGETDEKTVATVDITPGAATSRAVVLSVSGLSITGTNTGGVGTGWTIKLKYGATTVKTITGGTVGVGSAVSSTYTAEHQPNSTSATTCYFTAANTSSFSVGVSIKVLGTIGVIEISGASAV